MRKDVITVQDNDYDITNLWTHRKTALVLNVTVGTLYVWISKGVGPRSYKLNGSRRYDPRDVQDFLRARMSAAVTVAR